MAARQSKYSWLMTGPGKSHGRASHIRPFVLGVPLSTLPAPLEHGALGVWDEVAVGAVLIGCAIAYAIWFYLSGRKDGPQDKE